MLQSSGAGCNDAMSSLHVPPESHSADALMRSASRLLGPLTGERLGSISSVYVS